MVSVYTQQFRVSRKIFRPGRPAGFSCREVRPQDRIQTRKAFPSLPRVLERLPNNRSSMMKRMFRSRQSLLALLVCLAVIVLSDAAQAQTRDKYLISAKAGGINFVSGNVTVTRNGATGREQLTEKDNLESGDAVTTGATGRVEVLLNPGS